MMTIAKSTALSTILILMGLAAGISAALLPQSIALAFIGIAGLLLISVMPELQRVPFYLSRVSFFTLIFSMLSIPDYYALVLPGLPWISVRRIVLLTCVTSTLITIAGSSRFRGIVTDKLKSSPTITAVFASFLAVSMISALQSPNPAGAMSNFANQVMTYYIPFICGLMCINNREDALIIIKIIILCVFIDAALGSIEFTVRHPFLVQALPPYMRDQVISSAPIFESLVTPASLRNGMYRANSIYIVALSWGEMCAIASPLTLYLVLLGKPRLLNLLGILGLAAAFISIVFSGSRGAYVGMLAGCGLYVLLWSFRRVRKNPGSLIGPILLTLSFMGSVAGALAVVFVGKIHTFVLGGGAAQASNMGRSEQWALAWPRIFSRPIFGFGPGTGPEIVGWTTAGGFASLDSYFINLLVSIGFLGFALFFAFFFSIIMSSARSFVFSQSHDADPLGALAMSLFAFCVYRYTLNQTENMTLVYAISATCISLIAFSKLPLEDDKSRYRG